MSALGITSSSPSLSSPVGMAMSGQPRAAFLPASVAGIVDSAQSLWQGATARLRKPQDKDSSMRGPSPLCLSGPAEVDAYLSTHKHLNILGSNDVKRAALRQHLFAATAPDTAVYDVFHRAADGFVLKNNEGYAFASGFIKEKITQTKREIQDSMAIARTIDGAEIMVVADGVGSHLCGEAISKVITHVVAREMAAGKDFVDALIIAKSEWQSEYVGVLAEKIKDQLAAILKTSTAFCRSDWQAELAVGLGHSFAFDKKINKRLLRAFASKEKIARMNDQELATYICNVLKKCKGPYLTDKEPATTLSVVKKFKKEGKTYINFYSVGDSPIFIFEKNQMTGETSLVKSSTPHNFIENCVTQFGDKHFQEQARKLSQTSLTDLLELFKIAHPFSNIITTSIKGNAPHNICLAENFPLEASRQYMVAVITDGIGDNMLTSFWGALFAAAPDASVVPNKITSLIKGLDKYAAIVKKDLAADVDKLQQLSIRYAALHDPALKISDKERTNLLALVKKHITETEEKLWLFRK